QSSRTRHHLRLLRSRQPTLEFPCAPGDESRNSRRAGLATAQIRQASGDFFSKLAKAIDHRCLILSEQGGTRPYVASRTGRAIGCAKYEHRCVSFSWSMSWSAPLGDSQWRGLFAE